MPHVVFCALRGDLFARIPAHQLVVHQIVVAEEHCADRTVGDDAGKRLQHVFRRSREGDRLDQHQPGIDGIGTKKLSELTEQHIVLACDVDRVAGCLRLVPVDAKQLLPPGNDAHPMVDLGLCRPRDVLFQKWRLLMSEALQIRRLYRALLSARVHERDIVLQQPTTVYPPIRRHVGPVQRIEGCLHLAAIRQQRPPPGLVLGVV
jgi:hypothetical protein